MHHKNSISLFPYFLISLFLFSCGNNDEISDYQIKGKLSGSSGETILLIDVNSSKAATLDTAKTDEDGGFYFTKKVPEKGFYSIQISPSNFITVILDSSEKMILEGDAKNIGESCKVSGSPDSELFLRFNEFTKKKFKEMEFIRLKQDSIRRVYEAFLNISRDSLMLDSLSKVIEPGFNTLAVQYRKCADETGAYIKKFINENTASFASIAAVQFLHPERDIDYFIKVSDALTEKYPYVKNLKGFQTYIQEKRVLALGMPAPEITMNDKNEKSLSLSSFKGKILLVDFWASWCKPCRDENPFLVSLYHKYKSKGLDVFSVSLDQDKEAWLSAIEKDKLVWKNHVSDLKQWESPVVKLYGITGIPFTVILDRQGKIAGKNLRGNALEEKIKELLSLP